MRSWPKFDPRVLFASAVLIAIMTGIFYRVYDVLPRNTDFQPHIRFAQEIATGERGILTHPLFHLAIIIPQAVTGGDWESITRWVIIGFQVLTALVIFGGYLVPALGDPRDVRRLAIGVILAAALMLISAISVLTWNAETFRLRYHIGYIMPHVYHNPTVIALKPFAVALFLYAVGVFYPERYSGRAYGVVAIAALLTILGTLAKPNYAIALLPILGLFGAFCVLIRRPLQWALGIVGILIPAGVILFAQIVLLPNSGGDVGSMSFMPFGFLMRHGVTDGLMRFVMSIAFPAVVYGLYLGAARRNFRLNFAWAVFAMGAFYTYFLVESNRGSCLW
ncbi:MAG: hypothetical protein MUF87_08755 [Anaerolineae bacterium]|nr:hypothetical protein [Anaerolineae bacterium]